jgi:hypothetical protein
MASASAIHAGLGIILKYDAGGPVPHGVLGTLRKGGSFAAEHDEVYALAPGARPEDMSEEDRREMAGLGWRWHEGHDCWAKFA